MAVVSIARAQPPAPPRGAARILRVCASRRAGIVPALFASVVVASSCGGPATISNGETVATPGAGSRVPAATDVPTAVDTGGEAGAVDTQAVSGLLRQIPLIEFRVVASHPHDSQAWTQGLAYAGVDRLYEGTGDYENSSLREVALGTGEVLRSVALPSVDLYGEGITVFGESVLQLTWRNGVGLVYREGDFALLGQFRYPAIGADAPREGWGITTDGANLYVSDGSQFVYVADAQRSIAEGQLQVTDVITVTWQGRPITGLNELEYVDGAIYANVWPTESIVRFDSATGAVGGRLDVSDLLTPQEREGSDIANGVAVDPTDGQLLVTGKRWPRLFVLQLG